MRCRASSSQSSNPDHTRKQQPHAKPADTFITKSIEGSLELIEQFMQSEEKKKKEEKARRKAAGLELIEEKPTYKLVSWSGSARGERGIALTEHLQGRSLPLYVALPLDQYSLLDPTWISRDPNQPDLFLLRIPLEPIIGVNLTPRIKIKVISKPEDCQVDFVVTDFVLGEPSFDEAFQVTLKASLRSVNKRSLSDLWSSAPFASTPPQPDALSSEMVQSKGAALAALVESRFECQVPSPLSAAPAPLLSATFSLLSSFTMQQLLPSFLKLLETDYSKWAQGASRSNTSISAKQEANEEGLISNLSEDQGPQLSASSLILVSNNQGMQQQLRDAGCIMQLQLETINQK